MLRLEEAVEKARVELTTTDESTIVIPYIAADRTGAKHINVALNRDNFVEIIKVFHRVFMEISVKFRNSFHSACCKEECSDYGECFERASSTQRTHH
jgi:hypothetical protein